MSIKKIKVNRKTEAGYDTYYFETTIDQVKDVDSGDSLEQILNNKADKTLATASRDGLMSKSDKSKLSTIESGANFVSVDDNLTSTSSVNALSAKQGKLLSENLTQLEDNLTSHLAQNDVIKHKATQISVVNPDTSATQPLQTFAQELFQSVSNGKDLIGTAITDVDNSVIVPSEPTFLQLAELISSFKGGAKIETGTTTALSSRSFTKADNTTSSSTCIQVTDLDFTPRIVLWQRANSYGFCGFVASLDLLPDTNAYGYPIINDLSSTNKNTWQLKSPAYMSDGGFLVPVASGTNYEYAWVAIG